MLCQPNATERATSTDDVTHRTLSWQTDIRIENTVNPSVLLNTMSD